MTRVSLSRLPGDRVLVVDGDAEQRAGGGRPAGVRDGRARPTRRAGCGTTPRGGTRRCWRPGCGSSAATTCGWATTCCGGRPRWTCGCWTGEQSEHWDRLGPEHAVRPGAVLGRRHGRAPARRPRGRPAAGRGGGVGRGRPARAAARGGVRGCPRRGRDDVRRRAVAGRRPRAPAHRPARAAAAPRRPAAAARGAGRRGAPRLRRARPQPRLAARAAGRAAPRRAGRRGHPRVLAARRSSTRASPRCCATSSSRTCSRPTAGPGSTSG